MSGICHGGGICLFTAVGELLILCAGSRYSFGMQQLNMSVL